jgi:uncharacterized protein DUF4124
VNARSVPVVLSPPTPLWMGGLPRGYGQSVLAGLMAMWLSVCWVELAAAQLYKWIDRQGTVHFSDNPSRVPSEYRVNVEVEQAAPPHPLPSPSEESALAPPAEDTAPSEPVPPAPPQDLLGRGADYWQQLAQHWAAKLEQSIHERDRLVLMHSYTRTLESSTRKVFDRGRIRADIARLEQALSEAEAQIQQAETMLKTTLPLEARRLGANPEWLKPLGTTPQ